MIEELPLRRSARFQQRLKSSAGKIRSRFKNIHMPHRQAKPAAAEQPTTVTTTTTTTITTENNSAKPPPSPRPADQKASRMERFRMALPERPKFSLPDKSKFHLPERPKFHMPERPKFHIDKSKFQIKRPNIQLPKSLSRPKKAASQRESPVSRFRSIMQFELKFLIHDFNNRRILKIFPVPRTKSDLKRRIVDKRYSSQHLRLLDLPSSQALQPQGQSESGIRHLLP